MEDKVPLPQLITEGYKPTTFDYQNGEISLGTWLDVFRHSLPTFHKNAMTDVSVPKDKREAAVAHFSNLYLTALEAQGKSAEEVNCLTLCRLRDASLRSVGFGDIFENVKKEENEAALKLLPSLIQVFDSMPLLHERWDLAFRGVFAGNLFDMGAAASAAAFESGQAGAASFLATRDSLLPRPWCIDNLDQAVAAASSFKSVLMFVDNAGSDVILGMLPLAREFLKSNATVILAANEGYTLNDITAKELLSVVKRICEFDSVFRDASEGGRLSIVSSGSCDPVIDLSNVSPALAAITLASNVDLVILEGMGRAIETNLYAMFKCDSMKLGMIKHPEVAEALGGRLYDCVCKMDSKVERREV
jgi:uncharacterized protein with ATP-grasp and redox domains